MKQQFLVLHMILVCVLGCSSVSDVEPPGPVARFGTAPTIDGVFEDGEWDDAEIVTVGRNQRFLIKHDSSNLYIALNAGGGNLWFNKDAGLHVLHWSAQLCSAEYEKLDSTAQILRTPFAPELWGLQKESPDVVNETLMDYLAENGWTANIAPMGHKMQSEFAISFDWLGVTIGSERFIEIPGIHISGGLMLARGDPEVEKIKAMSVEEREKQYPSLLWPEGTDLNHPLNMGSCPDTIRLDPADFGKIWIDLKM
jgi:hypothetical protein